VLAVRCAHNVCRPLVAHLFCGGVRGERRGGGNDRKAVGKARALQPAGEPIVLRLKLARILGVVMGSCRGRTPLRPSSLG